MKSFTYKALLPLTLLLLAGCSQDNTSTTTQDSTPSTSQTTAQTPEVEQATTPDPTGNPNQISFTTETILGEPITSDIFADYDLTAINIWATWCGPCVNEMPYLEELYQMLPENINFISICQDAPTAAALAENILNQSGATFETLVPSPEIESSILSKIMAFPTTIFVDKNGEITGTAMQGAPSTNVAATYYNMIEKNLAQLPTANTDDSETLEEAEIPAEGETP